MRTSTNFFLSIPQEEVMQYAQPLVELLGYKDFDGIGSKRGDALSYGSHRESYGALRKARAELAEKARR